MSDEGNDVTKSDHLHVLVSEWESLQDDIREYKKESHRRIIRGIIVMAAVAGYALGTSNEWLLGFIPVVIGVMYVIQVQETNHVYYRNWQSYVIEKKVQDFGIERFDWTEKFGPLDRTNTVFPEGWTSYNISKRQSPAGTPYLIGGVIYVFFIGYTVDLLMNMNTDPIPFLPGPLWNWVIGVYAIFTIGLILVGLTNLGIRDDFKEKELS